VKILPSQKVKTTGDYLRPGGLFVFRVLKSLSGNTYQIKIRNGVNLTLQYKGFLKSDSLYKVQIDDKGEIQDTPELINPLEKSLSFPKEKVVSLSAVEKELQKHLTVQDFSIYQHNNPEYPWKPWPDNDGSNTQDVITLNDPMVAIIPLMILFRSREYKGCLELKKKKEQSQAEQMKLTLEKDKFTWQFIFLKDINGYTIKASTNNFKWVDQPPEEWKNLKEVLKKMNYHCHEKINFLREVPENTENYRNEEQGLINIRV